MEQDKNLPVKVEPTEERLVGLVTDMATRRSIGRRGLLELVAGSVVHQGTIREAVRAIRAKDVSVGSKPKVVEDSPWLVEPPKESSWPFDIPAPHATNPYGEQV